MPRQSTEPSAAADIIRNWASQNNILLPPGEVQPEDLLRIIHSHGRAQVIRAAARIFEQRAWDVHAKDACWDAGYTVSRRPPIDGEDWPPLNGPAISFNREMRNAAAVRGLAGTFEGPAHD
jgi:hypothetical protein